MLDLDLGRFAEIMNRLIHILRDLEERQSDQKPLVAEERNNFIGFLLEVRQFFAAYEIDVEGDTARAINKLQDTEGRIKDLLYPYTLALRNHINDELRKRKFMFIPSAEAEYYEHHGLFGQEVAERFPKANREITEAGNCYATGNYTACVFHLMRAVEYGARKLIHALHAQQYLNPPNRPVELCTWDDLLKAMDKGVADLANGTRTNTRKKVTYEYYSHAVAQFRNFKNAWRNHVAHTRELYLPGQTKDIMDNTRQFMQHLATRLTE
ncbi:MAG: hypothetical protein ACJ741_03330 [Pyrinomonadaceae bacterium]